MTSWTGRTVIYEHAPDKEIARLSSKYKRLEEAQAGLEWALSNEPEIFPSLPYGGKQELRMATIDYLPDVPKMRIWFTFTDQIVRVLSVETLEPEMDDTDNDEEGLFQV